MIVTWFTPDLLTALRPKSFAHTVAMFFHTSGPSAPSVCEYSRATLDYSPERAPREPAFACWFDCAWRLMAEVRLPYLSSIHQCEHSKNTKMRAHAVCIVFRQMKRRDLCLSGPKFSSILKQAQFAFIFAPRAARACVFDRYTITVPYACKIVSASLQCQPCDARIDPSRSRCPPVACNHMLHSSPDLHARR